MKKRNRTYQTAADIVAGLVLASAFTLPGPGESPNAYAQAELYGPPPSQRQMPQAAEAHIQALYGPPPAEQRNPPKPPADLHGPPPQPPAAEAYNQALYGPPPAERRAQPQQRGQGKKMTQAPKQRLNKAKTRQKRSSSPSARRKRTK